MTRDAEKMEILREQIKTKTKMMNGNVSQALNSCSIFQLQVSLPTERTTN